MASRYFSAQTFDFLTTLAANNRRDWFLENKLRYEETVRQPPHTTTPSRQPFFTSHTADAFSMQSAGATLLNAPR